MSRKSLVPIVLPANPTNPLEAATKQYTDTMLPKAGGVMAGDLTVDAAAMITGNTGSLRLNAATGQSVRLQTNNTTRLFVGDTAINSNVPITLPADPVSPTEAATKQYVDAKDVMWVGPSAPADAKIEVWYDTDETAGGGPPQVDVYTVGSSTWTKPTGAKTVTIAALGGGGGGGSGRRGLTATVRQGGAGGGGAGYSIRTYHADDLPATLRVVVGGGGIGGIGQTADSTDGVNGTAGVATTIDYFGVGPTYLTAGQGFGGASGKATGTPSGGTAGSGTFYGGTGAGASSTGTTGTQGFSAYSVSGQGNQMIAGALAGGGGGGVTAANAVSSGGSTTGRADMSTVNISQGAGGDGVAGGNGSSITIGSGIGNFPVLTKTLIPGVGGSGAGSGNNSAGGIGGAGIYGGGGGGGGGSTDGSLSGAGGKGGDGIAVITTTF